MVIGWFVGTAFAGTITVPGDADSIVEAVERAGDGDVIEVGPGSWQSPLRIERAVTLVGVAGSDETSLYSSPFEDILLDVVGDGPVAVRGFALTREDYGGFTSTLVRTTAPLELSDLRIPVYENWYGDVLSTSVLAADAALTLRDVVFEGYGYGTALRSTGQEPVLLERVDFRQVASSDAIVDVSGGIFTALDVTFEGCSGNRLLRTSLASEVHLARVRASCSEASVPFEIDAAIIDVDAIHVAGIQTFPLLVTRGSASVRNALLWGAGRGPLLVGAGARLEVWSSILLGSAAPIDAASLSGGYDLFQSDAELPPELQQGAILTDEPGLVEWIDEGDPGSTDACGVLLAPGPGSPAIDAGDPSAPDRNGSRADLGATGGPEGYAVDIDRDGWRSDVDCADTDPDIRPGASEVPYDGIDQDCNGTDLIDQDGDGEPAVASGGRDCDDLDPTIGPGQPDQPGDGIDSDCDGADSASADQDGDGHDALAAGGDDCDDTDPAVHPGAIEDLGPADLDCDGWTDPAVAFRPRGCATVPGRPSLVIVALGALALAARRRRRA